MATNQSLRQGIYEGILYIFLKAGEAMDAMDVVTLDAANAGKVIKCAAADIPFGFVAEQVTTTGVEQSHPGGLVSHTAKVGDPVGVYICGGVYWHKAAADQVYGDEVVIDGTAGGKCVKLGTASAGTNKVGVVVEATANGDTTHKCKIKSYL